MARQHTAMRVENPRGVDHEVHCDVQVEESSAFSRDEARGSTRL